MEVSAHCTEYLTHVWHAQTLSQEPWPGGSSGKVSSSNAAD